MCTHDYELNYLKYLSSNECKLASDNYFILFGFDTWSCLYHTGQVPVVHVGVKPPDGELNLPGVEEPQSTPSAGLVGGCNSLKSALHLLTHTPSRARQAFGLWTLKETLVLRSLGHLGLLRSCSN